MSNPYAVEIIPPYRVKFGPVTDVTTDERKIIQVIGFIRTQKYALQAVIAGYGFVDVTTPDGKPIVLDAKNRSVAIVGHIRGPFRLRRIGRGRP